MFRCLALAVLACGPAAAQDPPPVIGRPTEVWWGAFQNNHQLVDAGASQWTFVQTNMDGYLLHGAYWNFTNNPPGPASNSPTNIGPKLATISVVDRHAQRKLQELVGCTVEILCTGPSRHNEARLTGRTRGNKIVVFDGGDEFAGQLVDMEVRDTAGFTLYGSDPRPAGTRQATLAA